MNGILPLNKPAGQTSFSLVSLLRKVTGVQTIGHAGTLDPFATGVMILLIGRAYTRLSNEFLSQNKQYQARLHLGISTETYDLEGQVTSRSSLAPTLEQIKAIISKFQGTVLQVPPMFSAKKIKGKKLYELARRGITIERAPIPVTMNIDLLNYTYPYVDIDIQCSKGTYIRSLAHDIGQLLGCGAHLVALNRVQSGAYTIKDCLEIAQLFDPEYDWKKHLKTRPVP